MLNFDEMLSDLGKNLEIELAFNEDGVCELLMDEKAVISLIKNEKDGVLTLSSVVADELPDPVGYSLILDLLDFSLGSAISHSPAVGRDPETGLLVAYQIVTASLLTTRAFTEIFHDFTRFCSGISAAIANNLQVGPDELHGGSVIRV